MVKFGLRKREILSSKKIIASLFNEGDYLYSFPLKIQYRFIKRQDDSPALFSVSVPKKKIKKAVNRNLLKRRIREAYRLNKHTLYIKIPKGYQLVFMIIYLSDSLEKYPVIEKSIKKLISKIKIK